MLMFAGAWDEDERVYEEFYRNFLPLIINVFIDSVSGEDAFKGVRVYSKGLYEIIKASKYLHDSPSHGGVSSEGMSML